MAETADKHIWRTDTGELVAESDVRARFLAYAPGDELSESDSTAWKKRGAPDDKQRRAPENKAAPARLDKD